MLFIKIFITILITQPLYSQDSPAKLATKQAIENIRYITKDGKFTYYHNQSGQLLLSSNYSFHILDKDKRNTQYFVSASRAEKKVVIEKIESPHSNLNNNKLNSIFISDLGSKKLNLIGNGVNPKLHLEDTWISYYNPLKKEITLQSLIDKKLIKNIKLLNSINPYFVPAVLIISPTDFMYTDINKNGHEALLSLSSGSKSIKPVYKSRFAGSRINTCKMNDKIIVGEFPNTYLKRTTQIVSIEIYNNENYKNFNLIYSSELPDIGNMKCFNKSIYFIKTYNTLEKINFRQTDVVKVELKDSKLSRLTRNKNLTQLFVMANSVLSPSGKDFLVIEGKSTIQDDSIIQDIK